jgi:DNA-binding transcriptional LysR family regulator
MLLPSIRQLESFLHVARLKSFRRAASALHISQPALSQSVSQLERQLGAPLLTRSTRSVALTSEGELLLERLEKLIPELYQAVGAIRDARAANEGRVRVGCIASAALQFLPRAIVAFRGTNPKAVVTAIDGSADGLNTEVLRKNLDFAVSSSRPDPKSGLVFEKVLTDSFRAVLRRDHVLSSRKVVTWKELLEFDFLGLALGSGARNAIDAALAGTRLIRRPIMELTQLGTVLGLLETGIGVGALPSLSCPTPDHPILCSRPLISPEVKREIGFVTLRDATLSDSATRFRDLLRWQMIEPRRQDGRRGST